MSAGLDQTKERWEAEVKKSVLSYPDIMVVRWISRNFKNIEENYLKKALDIGCGSGRHMKLLQDYGFDVYGIDYNQECLNVASEILGIDRNKLTMEDIRKFETEEKFDLILLWGVIFLRGQEEIERNLTKVYSLLNPGGKILIDFRTKHDWLFGRGEKLDANTCLLGHEAGTYSGMLYTFFDLDEIKDMMKRVGFEITNIEREDYWKDNLKYHNSWFVVSAKK